VQQKGRKAYSGLAASVFRIELRLVKEESHRSRPNHRKESSQVDSLKVRRAEARNGMVKNEGENVRVLSTRSASSSFVDRLFAQRKANPQPKEKKTEAVSALLIIPVVSFRGGAGGVRLRRAFGAWDFFGVRLLC
jgi:hypothetical protein